MLQPRLNPRPRGRSQALLSGSRLNEHPGIRVMLVDESASFLRAATFFLEQQPEVALLGSFSTGEDAVECARQLKPQIVLLDLTHAGLPGLEMITRLRTAAPGVQIIVLSLLDIAPVRRAAFAAGAAAFVSKANSKTDLMATIRGVANDETRAQDHQGGFHEC